MATKKTAKTAVTKTKVIKSAKTGEFVSKQHASTHPATTFSQTVTKPVPAPPKKEATKKATSAQVKVLKKALAEPQNAKAAKAVTKAAKAIGKPAKDSTMKKVSKALNVTNSRPPDFKKAVEVFAKDVLSPQLPTHSDNQINKLVGKAKTSAKPTAVRASASRAEVRQSAVADAREIFK